MPVILTVHCWHGCLDGRKSAGDLEAMQKPYPAEKMDCYRGTPEVKNSRFEDSWADGDCRVEGGKGTAWRADPQHSNHGM